jgi:hypothetical protein
MVLTLATLAMMATASAPSPLYPLYRERQTPDGYAPRRSHRHRLPGADHGRRALPDRARRLAGAVRPGFGAQVMKMRPGSPPTGRSGGRARSSLGRGGAGHEFTTRSLPLIVSMWAGRFAAFGKTSAAPE